MTDRDAKANPDSGPSIFHDFHCTHGPCKCEPTLTSEGVSVSSLSMDNRVTRPCHSCGGKRTCRWAEDAWHCGRCGDEWNEEHDPIYAPPGSDDRAGGDE